MSSGWIALWCKFRDSDLWLSEKFTRGQAWLDMLMHTYRKDGFKRVRGIKVKVARGQCPLSEVEMAGRWRWSRNKVRRFLAELKAEQQIEQQKGSVTSLNTIVNFDQYQYGDTANGTANGTANDTALINTRQYNSKQNPPTPLFPEIVSPEVWKAFKVHRTAMKAKLTPHAEKLIIGKLEKMQAKGIDPNEVLNRSIENGWKGVFEPKGFQRRPDSQPPLSEVIS